MGGVREFDSGEIMQRRFTERRVNANVEWYFVIGQCHGNGTLFDVGVDVTCASNAVHKVPSDVTHVTPDARIVNPAQHLQLLCGVS